MLARYTAATVFVDHYSSLSYVHMQRDQTSEELMKSKMSFENYAKAHGVQVCNYHSDNGRFADNAFINDAKHKNQGITYCGVNAHHQNGKAEKRI